MKFLALPLQFSFQRSGNLVTLNSSYPSSLPLTPKCCFELFNTLFSHLLCGDLPPRTLCSVSICIICYLGLLHPGILFFLSILSWGLDTIFWIQLFFFTFISSFFRSTYSSRVDRHEKRLFPVLCNK